MEKFLFSFWWLIFPIMWFGFGFLSMFLRYRRQRDFMDLLKTYAAQGKEPPPEVAKMLSEPDYYGYRGGWGRGWGGGCGPRGGAYWEWRRVFIFTSLAVGFGVASYYGEEWGVHGEPAFVVVAAVMACLAVGSLLFALLARRLNGDEK